MSRANINEDVGYTLIGMSEIHFSMGDQVDSSAHLSRA